MAMGTPAGEGEQLPGPETPAARPQTGDFRVDEALARLDELGELPVAEHPAVFEHVHQRLAEALGDLGTGDDGDDGDGGDGLGDAGLGGLGR
jgi:hypothetical protein